MQPGTVLANRYRLEGLLGEGGMGLVYAATTVHNGRRVAIKTLRPNLLVHGRLFVERLRREALAMCRFDHPNVVRVLDLVLHGERPFLVMEYLHGASLGSVVRRRGAIEAVYTARMGAQVLRALDLVHREGFVHRDVKPDNVFLLPDLHRPFAKLLDFGLVKRIVPNGNDPELTQMSGALGTWQYMAPEQGLGAAVDGRTDLYSVGACLYYALTGKKPHQTTTMTAEVFACSPERTCPLRDLRPDLSETFTRIVDRALCKDPDGRWASASEMAAALEATVRATPSPEWTAWREARDAANDDAERDPTTLMIERPEVRSFQRVA